MKKILLFVSFILLVPCLSNAQKKKYTISGTVVNAKNGKKLPGANINLKGSNIGTATTTKGKFNLEAELKPGSYTLVFSFVGFKSKKYALTLAGKTTINIGKIPLKEDLAGLNELVVTGTTAATSKKKLGNAISTVDAGDIENTGVSTVNEALSGRVAGAKVERNSGNPAGGISLRLRGTATVLGKASPLYIIDGVIVNNDSPELLDEGGTSTNRLADLNPQDIDHIEVVKGAAAAALYGSRANNGVVQIFTKKGKAGQTKISYSSKFNVNHVRKTLDVNMAKNAQGQYLDNDGNVLNGKRYDLQNEIFRTAVGTDQNLSISGGNGNTQYYISGSYKKNQGIVQRTDFKRGTLRLNLDQGLSDWADLAVHLNYSNSRSDDMPEGGLHNTYYGLLTGFIFGPNDVNPYPNENGKYPKLAQTNPLDGIAHYDYGQKVNRVIGGAKLSLTPIQGLSINHIIGIDTYNQVATAYVPPGTTTPGRTNGFGRRGEQQLFQMNNDLKIRYRTSVFPSLESTSLLGGSLQYKDRQTVNLQAKRFVPGSKVVTGGADFDQPNEFRSEVAIYGIFGQQTFGFKDKYFITGAGRFDASSVFGKNDRWQFFPKVSGSYLISEEQFWKHSFLNNVFNTFKLRGSLGYSGGQTAIGAYDRFNLFNPASVNGNSALIPTSERGAPNVKPERQREYELGIDAALFSSRLSFEFTWYNQHTTDLLLFRNAAPTTGFLTKLGNYGELDNRGVELRVKGVPINGDKVQWTTIVTYSANQNEVHGIEGGTLIIPDSFGQVAAINGQPLGVFYSDAFARDKNGDIKKDQNDLPIEASGNHVIGDPHPDWTGSLINNIQVGSSWNFRAQFDVSYGNDVFNFTRRLGSFPSYGTLNTYQRELEGKLPAGYNARVFGIFENWIEDGSYIKLRELSASYTLHAHFWSIQSLKFNVVGRNLFSIDSYNGYDPETNVGGQRTAVRGFDFVQVPIPRSVTMGVRFNF